MVSLVFIDNLTCLSLNPHLYNDETKPDDLLRFFSSIILPYSFLPLPLHSPWISLLHQTLSTYCVPWHRYCSLPSLNFCFCWLEMDREIETAIGHKKGKQMSKKSLVEITCWYSQATWRTETKLTTLVKQWPPVLSFSNTASLQHTLSIMYQ